LLFVNEFIFSKFFPEVFNQFVHYILNECNVLNECKVSLFRQWFEVEKKMKLVLIMSCPKWDRIPQSVHSKSNAMLGRYIIDHNFRVGKSYLARVMWNWKKKILGSLPGNHFSKWCLKTKCSIWLPRVLFPWEYRVMACLHEIRILFVRHEIRPYDTNWKASVWFVRPKIRSYDTKFGRTIQNSVLRQKIVFGVHKYLLCKMATIIIFRHLA
jgi:hypothetical protein